MTLIPPYARQPSHPLLHEATPPNLANPITAQLPHQPHPRLDDYNGDGAGDDNCKDGWCGSNTPPPQGDNTATPLQILLSARNKMARNKMYGRANRQMRVCRLNITLAMMSSRRHPVTTLDSSPSPLPSPPSGSHPQSPQELSRQPFFLPSFSPPPPPSLAEPAPQPTPLPTVHCISLPSSPKDFIDLMSENPLHYTTTKDGILCIDLTGVD
ncbi:hypothetical protein EI94DRAFT_1809395 [Lactarius quietus]|nr:hypothetical protein EI94DRAFT_1809395 [Lactarius quietus]